jgi:hypothetical protein
MDISTSFATAPTVVISPPSSAFTAYEQRDWTSMLPSTTMAMLDSWSFSDSWQSKIRLIECIGFATVVSCIVFVAASPVLFS